MYVLDTGYLLLEADVHQLTLQISSLHGLQVLGSFHCICYL